MFTGWKTSQLRI